MAKVDLARTEARLLLLVNDVDPTLIGPKARGFRRGAPPPDTRGTGGGLTMTVGDFFKHYLLLPVSIILQLFGYIESAFNITGIPNTFLLISAGFMMLASLLVWVIWFSELTDTSHRRGLALVGLIALSIGYYTYMQYSLVLNFKDDLLRHLIYLESARDLVTTNSNEAIDQMSKLIDGFQKIPEVYNIRGTAYYKLGRYKDALKDFQRATELDRTGKLYRYNVAITLREMCNLREAKKILDEYVEANKHDMSGYYERAVVYHLLTDYENALAGYKIIIANSDDYVESASFNAAVIYAFKFNDEIHDGKKKDYLDKVIKHLDRSIYLGGQDRIRKIENAFIPIAERQHRDGWCEGYDVTDDLTPLQHVEMFMHWWHEKRKQRLA